MSKKLGLTLLGIVGVGAVAGGVVLALDDAYDKGKKDGLANVKPPVVQEEQNKYYNIYTLTNVGEDVQITKDDNDNIKLTYNGQEYLYEGESIVNFSYNNGPVANYCSEFGEAKIYHTEVELLYFAIETPATANVNGNEISYNAKSVYDAELNLLGETELLSHQNIDTVLTLEDGTSYTVKTTEEDVNVCQIRDNNGATPTAYGTTYSIDSMFNIPTTHCIDLNDPLRLYVNGDEIVAIRVGHSRNWGWVFCDYKLVNGIYTLISMYDAPYNYSDSFQINTCFKKTSITNIQFVTDLTITADSVYPPVKLVYNDTEYTVNGDYSNLDVLHYSFVNGESIIEIKYDGTVLTSIIDGTETAEELVGLECNISNYSGTWTFNLDESIHGETGNYTVVLDGVNATFTKGETTHNCTTGETSTSISGTEVNGKMVYGRIFFYSGDSTYAIMIDSANNMYLIQDDSHVKVFSGLMGTKQ